jgi:hypothetical protein
MINGFVVNIINNTNEQKEICLFKEGGITEDVLVHVFNNPALDYNSLLNIARTKGFMGNGLQSDYNTINSITIHKEHNTKVVYFNNLPFITDLDLTINGFSNYISLWVPPSTTMYLQLMPNL